MPRQYTHDLQTWVDSNPKVKTWYDKKALGSKNTASVYGSSLFRYWRDALQSRFGTIDKWIDSIKGQQKSDEVEVQRQWGSDLQGYIHSTNLMEGSRFVLVQAVKSFLKQYLNLADYSITLVLLFLWLVVFAHTFSLSNSVRVLPSFSERSDWACRRWLRSSES